MPSRMQFEAQFSRSGSGGAPRRRDDAPLRILLLGDFSASAAAERAPLAQRPTLRVDLDNLDGVMRKLAPRAQIAIGGAGAATVTAEVLALDHFHPDHLFEAMPLCRALRETRQRLLDPAQFEQAAAELRLAPAPGPAPAAPSPAAPAATAGGDLLGQLLGSASPARPAAPAPQQAASAIDALIRGIVAPHIVADSAPFQAQYLASVDSAIGEQMRACLHAPAFQSLESAWRGVQWLIASLELDDKLQLHLFDVTRDEIQADLVAAKGQVGQTALHQALVDRWRQQPGADGWSVLAGLYSFGPGDADIAVLAALGQLASQVGAPLLAAATPAMVGAASFETPVREWSAPASWQALRR
ncbi:MAG: type VI secretion system contractile sheath large subunit, partial [Rubrivivax sp.]|nr:type VI secretion system contractile sheath large subunit [Rubrivivax sp.]